MHGSILKRASVLSLTALLPLALACGGGEPGGEMGGTGEEAADQPAAEPTPAPTAQPATAGLQAMGESGVTGEVSFARQGMELEVQVTAQNVSGTGARASHIHQGMCNQPGGVIVPLNDVSVADGGTGEATTTVDATQLEAGQAYLVMVHGAEGAPIACANMPASVTQM